MGNLAHHTEYRRFAHLILRHNADLLRHVCEDVEITDVLALSEVLVEDRIQELLLHLLPADIERFAAEAVSTDGLANVSLEFPANVTPGPLAQVPRDVKGSGGERAAPPKKVAEA